MTLAEIRQEYGSMREAIRYFAQDMGFSKRRTAQELGIPEVTFHRTLTRLQMHGVFLFRMKQHSECRGKGGEKKGAGNRDSIRLYRRKPIEHNGVLWYPGEPMHHYLFSKGGNR